MAKGRTVTTPNQIRILAIDPASVVCGIACGTWRPGVSQDAVIERASLIRETKTMDSEQRIVNLVDRFVHIVEREQPDRIIVEIPSGKPGTGSKRGASYSLIIYGGAAFALRTACQMMIQKCGFGFELHTVKENIWTRRWTKRERQLMACAIVPGYQIANDPGVDAGDAACLLMWWCRQQEHITQEAS